MNTIVPSTTTASLTEKRVERSAPVSKGPEIQKPTEQKVDNKTSEVDNQQPVRLSKDEPAQASKKPSRPKPPPLAKRMANYFQPGRVVKSYYGQDRVESFLPGEGGSWTVEVHAVDPQGNRLAGAEGLTRTHSTQPGNKELLSWEKDNPLVIPSTGGRENTKGAQTVTESSPKAAPAQQATLEGVKVKVKAIREATGQEITIEDDAQEALAHLDSQIADLDKLLTCVSG